VLRYQNLDDTVKKVRQAKEDNPSQSFEESLEVKVRLFGGEEHLGWIYQLDIAEVWAEYLREH
jgi:salicylate hydroxylase